MAGDGISHRTTLSATIGIAWQAGAIRNDEFPQRRVGAFEL
jgi:hypothetical protein